MGIEPVNNVNAYSAVRPEFAAEQNTTVRTEAPEVGGETADLETAAVKKEGNVSENFSINGENQQNVNEKIRKSIDEMNKKMNHSEAQFGIHEETNRVTIKIVDKDTKEVIKELPPEKTLDMIAKAWEMAGILVDEKR